MNVSKEIIIDLNAPRRQVVHLGQSDSARTVVVNIRKDGSPFNPLYGATNPQTSVKFVRQDGTGGEYSVSPSGSSTPAVTQDETSLNVFTVKIDADATSVPGFTDLFIKFKDGSQVVHSFPITIEACKNDADDLTPTDPRYDAFLQKSSQATKTNAMTQEIGVDSAGKLWTAPGGGGSTPQVQNIVITESGGTYSSDTYNSDIQTSISAGYVIQAKTPTGIAYYWKVVTNTSYFVSTHEINDALYEVVYMVGSSTVSVESHPIDNGSIPAVRYDTASQPLTATQKGNARTNINAAEMPTETTLSGSTVTIAEAANNTVYTCGEISSLTISDRASNAAFSVSFNSPGGSTPTTLSIAAAAGITLPDDFQVEVYRHYEINVDKNGWALVASWSLD